MTVKKLQAEQNTVNKSLCLAPGSGPRGKLCTYRFVSSLFFASNMQADTIFNMAAFVFPFHVLIAACLTSGPRAWLSSGASSGRRYMCAWHRGTALALAWKKTCMAVNNGGRIRSRRDLFKGIVRRPGAGYHYRGQGLINKGE